VPPSPLYTFGEFRLDPEQRALFRNDEIVSLTPKAFDTLLLLIQNHGRVLDKDALLKKIWPDTFVEEGSLARNVSVLRKVLEPGLPGQECIENIPKRGYRFVADVRSVQPDAIDSISGAAEENLLKVSPSRPIRRFIRNSTLAMTSLLVASGLLLFLWHRYHLGPRARKVMLAVLPVQNLTGDPEREYISDGLTEEMVAQLGTANPAQLGVIARTSSMAYKRTQKTVSQIGRELGVDYVLESSLRGTGGRMSITAQLIRTSDQTHVWAQVYDRTAKDILAVQDDVARGVSRQIQISLLPEEEVHAAVAVNPEAYDAYLKGRFYWNKRTREDMSIAENYFHQSIEKDPNYAPGYVGLSDTYQLMVFWSQLAPKEGFGRARAAAEKAVALDGRSAEAHATLASIRETFDWDWTGAESEYRHALDLNPNYATAHHWYAEFLAGHGRFEQASSEINKALELDPLSPAIATTVGEMLCRTGHCEKAVEQYQKVLQMYSGYPQASYLLALAYARLGRYEQAVAQIDRAIAGPNLNPGWASSTRAYAAAVSGRRQEALNLIPHVKKDTEPEFIDYNLATVYAALGDNDRAFANLERARIAHDVTLLLIEADYRLDNIKADPRFKELLHRMNF